MNKLILLDPGHGGRYQGKKTDLKVRQTTRDQVTFYEGLSNRATVADLQFRLEAEGIHTHIIGDWHHDVTLSERVLEVNEICNSFDCILVSVHSNGFSQESARGWECFVSEKASQESRLLANLLHERAIALLPGIDRGIKEANFTILSRTRCPAVLVENYFSTNPDEFYKLFNPSIRHLLTVYAFDAIKSYVTNHWPSK